MTDRDALLRAICENPADDAPRLVYADWLEENGDPRQAEFVRVQIELARGSMSARRVGTLQRREAELWGGMKKWRYLPFNWISLSCGDFQRGFNTRCVGPVASFLFVSPNFCRHGPVETLTLSFDSDRTPPLSEARLVAECPILGCVKDLTLSGARLDDGWAIAFVSSPFAGRWQSVTLSGDDLSDAVCDRLASSPLAGSGCRIRLRSARLTRRGRDVMDRVFGARPREYGLDTNDADEEFDADIE